MEHYPLAWPQGHKRTRFPGSSRFKVRTEYQALQALYEELERIGAIAIVVTTNLRARNDGGFYARQRKPDDRGVAVYFHRDGKEIALPCDTYDQVADNLYAIARTIAAMRQVERDGIPGFITRAFTGYTALPAPGTPVLPIWAEALGFDHTPTLEELRIRYRDLAREHHPDSGQAVDGDRFIEIQSAYTTGFEALTGGANG
jgi:hypothetical protein